MRWGVGGMPPSQSEGCLGSYRVGAVDVGFGGLGWVSGWVEASWRVGGCGRGASAVGEGGGWRDGWWLVAAVLMVGMAACDDLRRPGAPIVSQWTTVAFLRQVWEHRLSRQLLSQWMRVKIMKRVRTHTPWLLRAEDGGWDGWSE